MAEGTGIEWTDSTWNPVTGCSKVSPGCRHCYAERMARRLQAMGQPNYRDGFAVRLHEHVLELPLRLRSPQTIFVNSMSDLFHEAVPLEFIRRVFASDQTGELAPFSGAHEARGSLREVSSQLHGRATSGWA